MSRKVYDNGQLVESWDDVTRTYRRYVNGSLVETRPYTAEEIGAIVGAGRVVVDERDVVMYDDDGSVIFRMGEQTFGDRGVSIFRDDGSLAFAIRKAFGGTTQSLEMRDRFGSVFLAEEALGSGLSRPYLHSPMQPVLPTAAALLHGPYGPQVPVTSGTFVTTHQAWYARHNQYGVFKAQISASDTSTSAEVRVINAADGVPLGAFFQPAWLGARAAGSTGYIEVASPALYLPGVPDALISIALQVRRTAGSGTLQVSLPESHGA